MLKFVCKQCNTTHEYPILDTCTECHTPLSEQGGIAPKNNIKSKIFLLGLTFTTGVYADDILFDKEHNIAASPNEIHIVYNSMIACVSRKSDLSTKALNNYQYNIFAKECSQELGKK